MERQSRASPWQGYRFPSLVLPPVEGSRQIARLAAAVLVITLTSIFIGLATGLVVAPLSPARAADPSRPVARVLDDALTWRGAQDDPAITLPSGVQIKSSNFYGVRDGDTTYYYNLAPRPSYDPLARGDVTEKQIRVLAVVGDPPNRVVIYSINGDQQLAVSSQPAAVSK